MKNIMSGPIKTSEVENGKSASIPEEVFAAFNELIIQKINVSGQATFQQNEVVALILKKMPNISRTEIYKNGWLDVEVSYINSGWKVSYDKPGYNESYPATFTFEK